MTDLRTLAEDVSWRGIYGPRAHVDLDAYGADARRLARQLGMVIQGHRAYLTERTPDLAEVWLAVQGAA